MPLTLAFESMTQDVLAFMLQLSRYIYVKLLTALLYFLIKANKQKLHSMCHSGQLCSHKAISFYLQLFSSNVVYPV